MFAADEFADLNADGNSRIVYSRVSRPRRKVTRPAARALGTQETTLQGASVSRDTVTLLPAPIRGDR